MVSLLFLKDFFDLNLNLIFFVLSCIFALLSFFIGRLSRQEKVKLVAPIPPPTPIPSKIDYQIQGIIPYDDDDDFVTNEKLSIKITHKKLYDDKNIKLLILDDSIDKIFGTTFFISLVCLILDVII